jgi:hypothetical protein
VHDQALLRPRGLPPGRVVQEVGQAAELGAPAAHEVAGAGVRPQLRQVGLGWGCHSTLLAPLFFWTVVIKRRRMTTVVSPAVAADLHARIDESLGRHAWQATVFSALAIASVATQVTLGVATAALALRTHIDTEIDYVYFSSAMLSAVIALDASFGFRERSVAAQHGIQRMRSLKSQLENRFSTEEDRLYDEFYEVSRASVTYFDGLCAGCAVWRARPPRAPAS